MATTKSRVHLAELFSETWSCSVFVVLDTVEVPLITLVPAVHVLKVKLKLPTISKRAGASRLAATRSEAQQLALVAVLGGDMETVRFATMLFGFVFHVLSRSVWGWVGRRSHQE